MSNGHPPPESEGFSSTLLERVRARVLSTSHAIQRRDGTSPRPSRPPRTPRAAPGESSPSIPHSPEHRALLVVYHHLGRTHRRYREQTGDQVPTALKAAARAFKREPSVSSLVPVAGFLDDLGLLKW
ncbi:MAG TPA: hypothetical protein VJK71_10490 [Gemmatimonadales bacterium]|nr:hypothetical protein [Gemmatimonadales bacterium]